MPALVCVLQLVEGLSQLAARHPVTLLLTRSNQISVCLQLDLCRPDPAAATRLGSMLFTRGVSGTRVVTGVALKAVEGVEFRGWGGQNEQCTLPYLTAAAAIGVTEQDIERFLARLDKVLGKVAGQGESETSDLETELASQTSELML